MGDSGRSTPKAQPEMTELVNQAAALSLASFGGHSGYSSHFSTSTAFGPQSFSGFELGNSPTRSDSSIRSVASSLDAGALRQQYGIATKHDPSPLVELSRGNLKGVTYDAGAAEWNSRFGLHQFSNDGASSVDGGSSRANSVTGSINGNSGIGGAGFPASAPPAAQNGHGPVPLPPAGTSPFSSTAYNGAPMQPLSYNFQQPSVGFYTAVQGSMAAPQPALTPGSGQLSGRPGSAGVTWPPVEVSLNLNKAITKRLASATHYQQASVNLSGPCGAQHIASSSSVQEHPHVNSCSCLSLQLLDIISDSAMYFDEVRLCVGHGSA